MEFSPKLKKILISTYILILLFSVVFVYRSVNSDGIEVKEKQEKKDITYYKPVRFILKISSAKQNEEFSLRMQNDTSLVGVIDELRKDGKLTYEKTAYRYGTDIVQINKEFAPEGFDWKIYANGVDVTYDIAKIKVDSNAIYEVKLVRDDLHE